MALGIVDYPYTNLAKAATSLAAVFVASHRTDSELFVISHPHWILGFGSQFYEGDTPLE